MGRRKGKPKKPVSKADSDHLAEGIARPGVMTWDEINHFTPREFTCKCDGFCDHPSVTSLELVARLDRIRDLIGKPISILSGSRCEKYNRKVGGKARSAHIAKNGVSHAADIHCPDSNFRFAFLVAALPMFNRIGIGKDFIHVDMDPELPAHAVWVYC